MKQSFLLLTARPIFCCLAAVFLVLCSYPVYGSYSRNISFGTTRITYDELMQVINKTHNFMERANANIDERISNERLSIGDGNRTIEVRDKINLNLVKELPKIAYIASYSIDNRHSNSPITSVKFEFNDVYRTLTVEGNNSEEIDALFSFLQSELDKYSYFLGGPTLRTFGGLAFFVLLWLIPLVFLSTTRISKKAVAIVIISCLTISVALVILPFDKWLPGFAAYDLNSSFLVRNSALFTFVSFIAIPLSLVAKGVLWLLHKRTEEDRRTERIETRIGEAIHKVEEIKKSPGISPHDVSVVEDDIRKIAEEFFLDRTAIMLSKKQVGLELEVKEMRLNTEWRPVYSFIVQGLSKLIEAYNEKLSDSEKITYTIPALPSNIFSPEFDRYEASMKFSSEITMSMRFYVRRPYKKDLLPSVFFEIHGKLDPRVRARFHMDIDPEEKVIQFGTQYDHMNIGVNQDKQKLVNDNYKTIILDFLKKIIEHQLIV